MTSKSIGHDVWLKVYKYTMMVNVYEAIGSGETVDKIISISAIDHMCVNSYMVITKSTRVIFTFWKFHFSKIDVCQTILFYSNID